MNLSAFFGAFFASSTGSSDSSWIYVLLVLGISYILLVLLIKYLKKIRGI